MQIAGAIGSIAAASLGAIVVLVVLFGLGVLGIARHEAARSSNAGSRFAVIGAGAAFLVCFVIALFGLYLIVVH